MAGTMLVRASNFEAVHLELFFGEGGRIANRSGGRKKVRFGIPSLKIVIILTYLGAV